MRFVILHYHFLKNAGTSIEELLHRSFGGYFTTIDTADRDGNVSEDALIELLSANPLLRAVSSHQLRYPVPQAPGYMFYDICFLRDPIDRVRSMYDYFRDKPAAGDPVSDLANRASLGEFVGELVQEAPWYVNDGQVNLLANGIANDAPTYADFERAVAQAMRCSFLGVVDCFAQSVAAGRSFLSPVFPELSSSPEAVNVSGGMEKTLEERIAGVREACGERLFQELVSLNELDARLVEIARSEVRRRAARAGVQTLTAPLV
jgi:hypothetical protein